jgi:hypothetical protein
MPMPGLGNDIEVEDGNCASLAFVVRMQSLEISPMDVCACGWETTCDDVYRALMSSPTLHASVLEVSFFWLLDYGTTNCCFLAHCFIHVCIYD